MKRSRSFWLLLTVAVFLLVGCGGGGGGSSESAAPSPPGDEHPVLTGTYVLTGFTVKYSSGLVVNEHSATVKSFSGTTKIAPASFTQVVSLNGDTYRANGTLTVEWTSATAGVMHVKDVMVHDVFFTLVGNNMSTYSGVQPYAEGGTFEEWEDWKKVSASYASEGSSSSIKSETTETGSFLWMADLLLK